MYIKEIKWLDKEEKEAILKVESEKKSLICFSHPCFNSVGDILTEPLECLNVGNIVFCETGKDSIEKLDGTFKYKMIGKLKDAKNGIIEVCGFNLHIDEKKIPGDMINGMQIQFVVPRVDIW